MLSLIQPTRRAFALTAAAAPFIWSRTIGAPAAPERISLGIIGVGKMGRALLGNFLNSPDAQVVAVADVVQERREDAVLQIQKKYADRIKSGNFRGAKAYSDFRDMLVCDDIDAVVIATPDHWHATASLLAIRAKKHVYCEKPLTHNVAEGRRLVGEVQKSKLAFQTGSQQRSDYNRVFARAVESVWAGRIGKLKTIRVKIFQPAVACDLPKQPVPAGTDWDFWVGPTVEREYNEILCPKGVHNHYPNWRKYREYGGGGLADFGAHHLDIAQWALKMDHSGPVEVQPPSDPKTGAGLRWIYANGVEVVHSEFRKDPKTGQELKDDCVFEGSEGTILVGRGGIRGLPEKSLVAALTPSTDHRQNWLDCIRSGKDPTCPVEVGHRSATLCHLGNITSELGRKLRWDPTAERFIDDAAANARLSVKPRAKWAV